MRLAIGLPVYNGETYLEASLDSLLCQTFEEFEVLIADNASTDGTSDICRRYAKADSRIRYIRHPQNLGLVPNHNFVLEQANADLFKWASHDDLYGPDYLKYCVEALDKRPEIVLAHSWTTVIDALGEITARVDYGLATASAHAPERFRSLLFADHGDDDLGVIRTAVLRRVAKKDSYYHADRTFISEVCLRGPFYQVPDWMFFRRDHPQRAERACHTARDLCATMDPRRADRFRHPSARLFGEYILGYLGAIGRAPLSSADRLRCLGYLSLWTGMQIHPSWRTRRKSLSGPRDFPAPGNKVAA
jgi:glycosyltransferase involved in cell wall biosynthesis